MAKLKIAVASRSFSKHPILRAELESRYPDASITFNDDGLSLTGDTLIDYLRGHDRAITALERIDDAVLTAVPELTVVSKYGVGIDMIDLAAMRRHGVCLGWTKGVNRRSVSELVISAVIALMRHVPEANREVLDGGWRQHKGRELSGKTVGIIGCGFVGKDLAVLLRAFGCRVLAHDILDFPDFYAEHDVSPADLNTVLAESDVVSLHVPLNDTTRMLLNRERMLSMKPGAILVNMARGGLVDEETLKEMLRDGRLAAAAFDVFNAEPPTDMDLLRMPNMLATPHIGGSAEEAILAMGRAAIDGLDATAPPELDLC